MVRAKAAAAKLGIDSRALQWWDVPVLLRAVAVPHAIIVVQPAWNELDDVAVVDAARAGEKSG